MLEGVGAGLPRTYRSWPTTAGAADDRKLAATSIDNKFIRAHPVYYLQVEMKNLTGTASSSARSGSTAVRKTCSPPWASRRSRGESHPSIRSRTWESLFEALAERPWEASSICSRRWPTASISWRSRRFSCSIFPRSSEVEVLCS